MKRGMEALNQAQHKAAETMYRSANAAGAGAAGPQPGGPDDQTSGRPAGDVIDAEVVEEEKR